MNSNLDRTALPRNVLDRLLDVERRLDDLEGFAALPNVDGSGDGSTTYIELLQEVEIAAGPGIDVAGVSPSYTVGLGLELPLLLRGDGATPAAEYATLALALAAASSGDTIWLPPGTYTGNHTVPAGVGVIGLSREHCILTGLIIGADGADLESLTISRTADDTDILRGVVGPASGTFRVHACNVVVTQSGTGNAYAAALDDEGDMEIWNSYLHGSSVGGVGYGGERAGGGNLYLYFCRVVGSSYPLSE